MGIATKNEAIDCDVPKPGVKTTCRVKDGGVFVTISQVKIQSETRASVLLWYHVPTPSNTMAAMCPKKLSIEMELVQPINRSEQVWEVRRVMLLSSC